MIGESKFLHYDRLKNFLSSQYHTNQSKVDTFDGCVTYNSLMLLSLSMVDFRWS